ncbi:MAG: CHASE3 domain-containing protein, partial [Nitrospiraceae bacterium]
MAFVTPQHPVTPITPEPAPGTSPAPTPKNGRLMEWLTHWSIERRVLAGFGLVFAGIVVISAISYRNTSVLIENSRLDSKSHELVQLLESVSEALDATERGHRRYLVTGEESYLKFYRSTVEQMPEYLRYLRGLTNEWPEQQSRVATLEALIDRQLDAEARAITRREKDGYEAVRHLALSGAAKNELERIHTVMTELDGAEQRALQARVRQSAGSTRNTIALLGLGALLQ